MRLLVLKLIKFTASLSYPSIASYLVTGDMVTRIYLQELGFRCLPTNRLRHRAAGVEPATLGGIGRVRYVSGQDNSLAPGLQGGVRNRYR
jgi:hypothetical protein